MKIVGGWLSAVVLMSFANGCGDEVLGKVECKTDPECPRGHICSGHECILECDTSIDCDDGNLCTLDLCDSNIGCVHEPAGIDGEACEADGLDTTRDICLGMICAASLCGDSWVDSGQTPAEDCDDGGNVDADGCQANCTYLPPTLQITAPKRAETLTGNNTVNVEGLTGDQWHGLESFTINGSVVDVAQDGSFSFPMTASWGLNTVEAVAVSNTGKSNRRALGYYFADTYASYTDPITTTPPLEDVLMTRVSQQALDDFDHPCAYDEEDVFVCTEVDDIATLGEISLNNLDLRNDAGDIDLRINVFHSTTPIITRSYPFNSGDLIVPGLSVAGDLLVTGEVNIDVAITDLDFNQLALMLASRAGGVNAEIAIDEHGEVPGFVAHVETTVEVPIRAAFDPATLTIDYYGDDALGLACIAMQMLGWGDEVAVICEGESIVGLAPSGAVGSEIGIERMLMTVSFDIYTAPGGGVVVELVGGNTDFFGSEILVDPIANMEIDLGSISLLGIANFPLGTVPVSGLATDLNTALGTVVEAFVNELQFLMEGAINTLLLNENDPLSVGQLLQGAVEGMAPNRAVELSPFGGQSEAPALTVQSEIIDIEVDAYSPSNLNVGGITSTLEVLYSSTPDPARVVLGSVLSDGCYPGSNVVFPEIASLEMAQHLDSMNQALFAVWQAGGFDFGFNNSHLPVDSTLASETFALTLEARGAPILNSCDGAPLALEIADVMVSGTVNGQAFSGFVSLSLPVAISAANDALRLSAQSAPPVVVIDALVGASVADLVGEILRREVVLPYCGQILTAMPTFIVDLSTLGGVPAASRLQMLPQTATFVGPYAMTTGVAGQ